MRAQKRCAQRGSRSRGRRCFRFCARRTGFIACDEPSAIGYWLSLVGVSRHWLALVMAGANNRSFWPALVMAGANNRKFWPSGAKTHDYPHGRGLVKTVWDSKLQTIVKNVQFPHARRWLEGLLGLLIANNRSFCPRVAKMHDYSRHNATSPKCLAVQRGPKRTIIRGLRLRGGALECSRGQNVRLFACSRPRKDGVGLKSANYRRNYPTPTLGDDSRGFLVC